MFNHAHSREQPYFSIHLTVRPDVNFIKLSLLSYAGDLDTIPVVVSLILVLVALITVISITIICLLLRQQYKKTK